MTKPGRFAKVLSLILSLLFMASLTLGCGENIAAKLINEARALKEAADDRDEWTLMLYICGADLESGAGMASQNLAEIAKTAIPGNINVLVATGGAREWKTEGIDPEYIEYYSFSGRGEMKRVEQKRRASMGEALTLGEFLAYGSENYPAKRYGAVLWDHGGGTRGIAYDEIYESDCLSLPELERAFCLANAHYAFVGMDACLMANIETAFTMEPFADYLIASEETVPGQGWDYAAMIGAIAAEPNIEEKKLARKICDSYYQKCKSNGNEDVATLSVIDLSKINALGKAFDEMSAEMTGMTEDLARFRELRGGILRAENYGGNTDNEGYFDMVDIGDMILNARDVLPETGEKTLNALFDAVVYKVGGSARDQANGISTFYPLDNDPDSIQAYAESAAYSANYLRFLEASTRDWKMPPDFKGKDFGTKKVSGNALSVGNTDISISAEAYVDKKGRYTLEFTDGLDYLQQVRFVLFILDEGTEDFLYLGEDDDFYVNEDGNVYSDNFQGMWPALNGHPVSLNIIEQNDEYNIYSVPLRVNEEPVNMRCIYRFESGDYEILGLWPRGGNGAATREIRSFQHGDLVQVMMDGLSLDSEKEAYITGEFAVNDGVVMEEVQLPDGDYVYQFVYEDLLGQSQSSPLAHIERKKGKTSVSKLEAW